MSGPCSLYVCVVGWGGCSLCGSGRPRSLGGCSAHGWPCCGGRDWQGRGLLPVPVGKVAPAHVPVSCQCPPRPPLGCCSPAVAGTAPPPACPEPAGGQLGVCSGPGVGGEAQPGADLPAAPCGECVLVPCPVAGAAQSVPPPTAPHGAFTRHPPLQQRFNKPTNDASLRLRLCLCLGGTTGTRLGGGCPALGCSSGGGGPALGRGSGGGVQPWDAARGGCPALGHGSAGGGRGGPALGRGSAAGGVTTSTSLSGNGAQGSCSPAPLVSPPLCSPIPPPHCLHLLTPH